MLIHYHVVGKNTIVCGDMMIVMIILKRKCGMMMDKHQF